MSIKSLDENVIDSLYEKYGFLDNEGYLVGTSDPNFLAVQKRVEQLAHKTKLTPEEEREGAELVIIQKAYMKELRDYVLDDGVLEEDEEAEGASSTSSGGTLPMNSAHLSSVSSKSVMTDCSSVK